MDLTKVKLKVIMKASKMVIGKVRKMAIMKVIVTDQERGKMLDIQEAIVLLK